MLPELCGNILFGDAGRAGNQTFGFFFFFLVTFPLIASPLRSLKKKEKKEKNIPRFNLKG